MDRWLGKIVALLREGDREQRRAAARVLAALQPPAPEVGWSTDRVASGGGIGFDRQLDVEIGRRRKSEVLSNVHVRAFIEAGARDEVGVQHEVLLGGRVVLDVVIEIVRDDGGFAVVGGAAPRLGQIRPGRRWRVTAAHAAATALASRTSFARALFRTTPNRFWIGSHAAALLFGCLFRKAASSPSNVS